MDNEFKYDVQKETEKACFICVPYWKGTDPSKRKNQQAHLTLWVPKSVIAKGTEALKNFIIWSRANARQANTWTKGQALPSWYKTLGKIAPVKVKKFRRVLDSEKYEQLVEKHLVKYGVKDLRLLYHNPDSYNVAESDYTEIEQMMKHTYNNEVFTIIPYKEEAYWQ